MINQETVWYMIGPVGLLSQMGGTINKLFRRIGIPIVVVVCSLMYTPFDVTKLWIEALLFLSWFSIALLPITLKGDDITDPWYNWLWCALLSIIMPLPGLLLILKGSWTIMIVIAYLIASVLIYGVIVLANHKATEWYVPWKLDEAIIWMLAVYPFCLLAQM